MSNIIIKVTTAQMEKMKQAYLSYLLPKKIPYTVFAAKKNGREKNSSA